MTNLLGVILIFEILCSNLTPTASMTKDFSLIWNHRGTRVEQQLMSISMRNPLTNPNPMKKGSVTSALLMESCIEGPQGKGSTNSTRIVEPFYSMTQTLWVLTIEKKIHSVHKRLVSSVFESLRLATNFLSNITLIFGRDRISFSNEFLTVYSLNNVSGNHVSIFKLLLLY